MATILAERASLDMRPVPRWYTASMRDLTAGKDTRGRIPYAEFYLNALRVPGSATARHHQATYGPDVSYFDFRTGSSGAPPRSISATGRDASQALAPAMWSWSPGTWTATRCGPPRSPTPTCRSTTGHAATSSET